MRTERQPWLACYIFRGEPWESLLTDCLDPFVREVLARRWAEQYFFIRYWERGPHIRLRFKGDREKMEETLRPRLDDLFTDYFARRPSRREDPEWVAALPPEQAWFPNDSLQYVEYEPEIPRYGGPVGIVISERQFQLSSTVVLEVVKDSEQWDYERALGAAIQLHLGFAHAMGMDLREAIAFFKRISNLWLARSFGYTPDMKREEVIERRDNTLTLFAQNFDTQKEVLIPFHQTIWEAFAENVTFEQEWLNTWVGEMRVIGQELTGAQSAGKLQFPENFTADPLTTVPHQRQLLWAILESYVHMTNNRLGILNRDEAFLGHLIHHSLATLAP